MALYSTIKPKLLAIENSRMYLTWSQVIRFLFNNGLQVDVQLTFPHSGLIMEVQSQPKATHIANRWPEF